MESRMAVRALSLSSWSDPTQAAGLDLGLTPREPRQGIALGGIWGGLSVFRLESLWGLWGGQRSPSCPSCVAL